MFTLPTLFLVFVPMPLIILFSLVSFLRQREA